MFLHSLPKVNFNFFPVRDAVDMLNALYNQVDEEVHKLVILSNKSQKELDSLLEVCRFEEQSEQVGSRRGSLTPPASPHRTHNQV